MGKIRYSKVIIIIILFLIISPLCAQDIDSFIEVLEKDALQIFREMAFRIGIEESLLSLEILSLEIDEDQFAPKVLVKSDIVFADQQSNEKRSLYFLSETKDSFASAYIAHLNEILPFVLSSLYSLETESNRLLIDVNSSLNAIKEGDDNQLGKRFVTTDKDENITSLLLATSKDDQFLYFSPLWADDELVRYMRISQGPIHAISILSLFNLNSLALNLVFEVFPIWGVVAVEGGFKGEFYFNPTYISLLAQTGLKAIFPFSIFFSDNKAHLWYSKLSLIARGLFGIGIRIENDYTFMYQSNISLLLQYRLSASLALSMGLLFNYSTHMPTKDSFVEYGSTQMMLGLSIVW